MIQLTFTKTNETFIRWCKTILHVLVHIDLFAKSTKSMEYVEYRKFYISPTLS